MSTSTFHSEFFMPLHGATGDENLVLTRYAGCNSRLEGAGLPWCQEPVSEFGLGAPEVAPSVATFPG